MADKNRRAWVAAFSVAPLVGGLVAWANRKNPMGSRAELSPRERIQKYNLPNVELVTHEGKKVRFYEDLVRDKKVVINCMYANCEGICVPVTNNLVKVQKLLGDRVGRDVFFYSITLKPDEDTPEVLQHYVQMHHVGPGWLFLTGEFEDMEVLRRGLGFSYKDPAEDADKTNHIGMLRYGTEAKMRWATCPGMAKPGHILRSILWEIDAPEPPKAG